MPELLSNVYSYRLIVKCVLLLCVLKLAFLKSGHICDWACENRAYWLPSNGCISPWHADSWLNSLHDWLMSLAMDLAALCNVKVKMAPINVI